jgi:biotin transport system substrate-specific component
MGTLSACVFPFIIPDLIKMAVAILLINRLRPIIK